MYRSGTYSAINADVTDAIGFTVGSIISAVYHTLFRDGILIDFKTISNGILPNKSVWIGARNHPASIIYATGNISYASIGLGITDLANRAYWLAVKKLMIALGRRASDVPLVKAGVCFSFDDESSISLRKELVWLSAKYGMRYTQCLETDTMLTDPWAATIFKILRIGIKNGLNLASHSLEGLDAQAFIGDGGTAQEYYDQQIATNVSDLETEFGITVKAFSYPYSKEVDDITTILFNNGFTFARSGGSPDTDCYYDGTNQFIKSCPFSNTHYTLNQYKGFIDDAFTNDKILLLHGHRISDTADTLNISLASLTSILEYINSKGMTNYTLDELLPSLFA